MYADRSLVFDSWFTVEVMTCEGIGIQMHREARALTRGGHGEYSEPVAVARPGSEILGNSIGQRRVCSNGAAWAREIRAKGVPPIQGGGAGILSGGRPVLVEMPSKGLLAERGGLLESGLPWRVRGCWREESAMPDLLLNHTSASIAGSPRSPTHTECRATNCTGRKVCLRRRGTPGRCRTMALLGCIRSWVQTGESDSGSSARGQARWVRSVRAGFRVRVRGVRFELGFPLSSVLFAPLQTLGQSSIHQHTGEGVLDPRCPSSAEEDAMGRAAKAPRPSPRTYRGRWLQALDRTECGRSPQRHTGPPIDSTPNGLSLPRPQTRTGRNRWPPSPYRP